MRTKHLTRNRTGLLSAAGVWSLALGILCLAPVGLARANDLPPTARIDVDPERPNLLVYDGETVFFDAGGSYDNDEGGSSITYYEWWINGGFSGGGSGAIFWSQEFVLGDPSQTVKLRVKDDEGNWGEKTITLTVTTRPKRYYYIKDHLGSVRVTFNENGDVVHYDDYYPFGLQMPGRSMEADGPKERFTGHEKDGETGLYYAGARFLDPAIGRWTTVDPLAEKYLGWSPYNYGLNSPLSNVDPDGRETRCKTEDECQTAADELNAAHQGETKITVEATEWEEDASVWWNPFTWGDKKAVSGYRLSTADSDFDWGQDKYTSALFDVINSSEIFFDLSIVSENFVMPRTPGWTAYDMQGANYASVGGGPVIVARSNRLGEPVGVVIMHELVGHGHPVGGDRASNVNDYYQARLGYQLRQRRGESPLHGGYLPRIGWQRTGLYGPLNQ